MKLIIAIVNYNDSNKVLNELSKHEIGATVFVLDAEQFHKL